MEKVQQFQGLVAIEGIVNKRMGDHGFTETQRAWIVEQLERLLDERLGKKPDQPEVMEVFEFWVMIWGKTRRAKLDAKRRRVITRAIRDYGKDAVMACLQGYTYSPWHNGSETGKVYDEIELHLRDSQHIEQGLAYLDQGKCKRGKAAMVDRALEVARQLDGIKS